MKRCVSPHVFANPTLTKRICGIILSRMVKHGAAAVLTLPLLLSYEKEYTTQKEYLLGLLSGDILFFHELFSPRGPVVALLPGWRLR